MVKQILKDLEIDNFKKILTKENVEIGNLNDLPLSPDEKQFAFPFTINFSNNNKQDFKMKLIRERGNNFHIENIYGVSDFDGDIEDKINKPEQRKALIEFFTTELGLTRVRLIVK